MVCTQLNGLRYSKRLDNSIWFIKETLTGTITPGQNEPGSNGNEGVLYILFYSRIGASPSDSLMSYPGYSLGWWGSYATAEMKSMYSTGPANKAGLYRNESEKKGKYRKRLQK